MVKVWKDVAIQVAIEVLCYAFERKQITESASVLSMQKGRVLITRVLLESHLHLDKTSNCWIRKPNKLWTLKEAEVSGNLQKLKPKQRFTKKKISTIVLKENAKKWIYPYGVTTLELYAFLSVWDSIPAQGFTGTFEKIFEIKRCKNLQG